MPTYSIILEVGPLIQLVCSRFFSMICCQTSRASISVTKPRMEKNPAEIAAQVWFMPSQTDNDYWAPNFPLQTKLTLMSEV